MISAIHRRKLLFGMVIGFLLLLMGILLLPALIDTGEIRRFLETRLQEQSGRRVQIQQLRLSLWSGIALTAEGVTFGEDPAYGAEPFLEAESLRVGIRLLPLLQGRQEPSALEIAAATIRLREGAQGWNFETLGKIPVQAGAGSPGAAAARNIPLPAIRLRNSRIQLYPRGGSRPWLLRDFSCSLNQGLISSGYRFSAEGTLETGKGDARVQANGAFQALPPSGELPESLQADFSLSGVPVEALADFPESWKKGFHPPPASGRIGFTGSIQPGASGQIALSGRLELDQLQRLDAAPLAAPLSLHAEFQARLSSKPSLLEFVKLEMRTGESTIQASGAIRELTASPSLDLRVSSPSAAPIDLLRLAALLRGGAIPTGTEGKLSFDLRADGPLEGPRLKGSLGSEKLTFTYPDLKEPVTISSIQVDFDGERLRTNRFSAGIGAEALLSISAEVADLSRDPSLSLQAQTSRPIPLNELLRIGSSFGLRLPAQMQVESGTAQFEVHAQGLRLKSRRFSVRGQAALDNAVCRLAGLSEPVSIPAVRLEMQEGRIRSNRFNLDMGAAGAVSAEFLLNDTAAGPEAQASIRSTRALNAEHWLEAGRAFGLPIPGGLKIKGGRLACDLELQSRAGQEPELRGSWQFQEAEVRSDLAAEPLFISSISVEMQPRRAVIRDAELRFLETRLRGGATVLLEQVPKVSLALQADRVNVSRLKTALHLDPQAAAPVPPQPAPASPRAAAGLPLTAEGKITIQQLSYETLELTHLEAAFSYEKQVLQLSALNFDLYSGKNQGSLRVDLSGDAPAFQYQGKLQSVDVHELMSRNTRMTNVLYGRLDATSAISGRGQSLESAAGSLSGQGIYRLSDGRITTFNLGRQIGLISRLAGWNFEGQTTELEEVDGSFRLDGGRMHLEKSRLKTPEALALCDGSIGLDHSLDLRGTAELSDQWKLAGNSLGQVIGGAAATFFRNEAGRIVVPFHLQGTVEDPAFVLDSETTQKALSRVLRPENIQSGVKAIGDIIRQAGKTAPPPTLLPPAASPGNSTSTTLPPQPADLIGGIGSLVGGILGAVQQSSAGTTIKPAGSERAAPQPNVTHLVQEISAAETSPLPALARAAKKARIDLLLLQLFAAPSP